MNIDCKISKTWEKEVHINTFSGWMVFNYKIVDHFLKNGDQFNQNNHTHNGKLNQKTKTSSGLCCQPTYFRIIRQTSILSVKDSVQWQTLCSITHCQSVDRLLSIFLYHTYIIMILRILLSHLENNAVVCLLVVVNIDIIVGNALLWFYYFRCSYFCNFFLYLQAFMCEKLENKQFINLRASHCVYVCLLYILMPRHRIFSNIFMKLNFSMLLFFFLNFLMIQSMAYCLYAIKSLFYLLFFIQYS